MLVTAAAALVTAFLLRFSALDDLGKILVVGVVALLVLYGTEYFLSHRR